MTRPLFVLSFGAWASGLSGGDRHLLEVAARWSDKVDIEVLAPPAAQETVQGFLGDIRLHCLGRSGSRVRAQGPALAVGFSDPPFAGTSGAVVAGASADAGTTGAAG